MKEYFTCYAVVMVALSTSCCSHQVERQSVKPQGSADGDWTHEATHQHRRDVLFEKVGIYGPATGTGTAAPFAR